MLVLTGEDGNIELWRGNSESLREAGGESKAGDCGDEKTEEECFGEMGGDGCELLPRRALHVGHILTNREMSSFGTLQHVISAQCLQFTTLATITISTTGIF